VSEQVSFRCDICGIEKQATNHWFHGYLLIVQGQVCGVFILPWEAVPDAIFTPNLFSVKQRPSDLCGEGHAIEWASKNLSK